jgi:hypothetical protein
LTDQELLAWAKELRHELETAVPELVHPYRWGITKLKNPEIVAAEVIYSVCEPYSKKLALEGEYDMINDDDYFDPRLEPQRLHDLLAEYRRG